MTWIDSQTKPLNMFANYRNGIGIAGQVISLAADSNTNAMFLGNLNHFLTAFHLFIEWRTVLTTGNSDRNDLSRLGQFTSRCEKLEKARLFNINVQRQTNNIQSTRCADHSTSGVEVFHD